jgi:hypothetical protein
MAVPLFIHYSGLIHAPKSRSFEFGERIFYTEILQGTRADALAYGDAHHRGSIWTITGLAGAFCVEQGTVDNDRGGIGTVTVKYVWLNSVPPEEWSCTPTEDNPPVERSAFFSALTSDDFKKARASFLAAQAQGQTSIDNAIGGAANATLIQKLVNKWLRGQETFYLASAKYQWKTYFTSMSGVILRRGGYIETPGGPGVLIPGFQWIRTCDEDGWNNGLYWVTRTWYGGPDLIGGWDADIYGGSPA